ncbi:unannotated protein [freshwater metagenome]|uniref:Unannotated protein n=1 Tax=freshwater metagenome TaxID=449393 RepID=A0A6J7HWQ8_9ZZZZ|nr:DUF3866 family protein [Actinomycetota bacterium]
MLVLRRGIVTQADAPGAGEQRLVVDVPGRGPRAAIADIALVGAADTGDDVVVNTQAADLELGSGGFDIVHVNLTRGLDAQGVPGAHVMKLNYSSLQHAVLPVEGPVLARLDGAAAVIFLHGQLAPLAWAFGQVRPGGRLGYVQTAGGALPGGHSRVVRELRDRGLLSGFLTAAPAYGGEGEAISTAGALVHGFADLGWDAAVCGPGPGILGSSSALGHGGMAALDSAHTALALGGEVVIAPRLSSGDPRERHQGLSHHAATVIELLLAPVTVAMPEDFAFELPEGGPAHHAFAVAVDLAGYGQSGLPTTTMGRSIDEDQAFFAGALAGGTALAVRTPERP